MKKLLITLALLLPLLARAQQEVKTDSLSTTLDEVVVTADTQIETAKKVILRPTKLEKRHSTNSYSLLENMNLPDFSASYMFGDWQVKGVYALPYNVLSIEGTKIHNPAQYGLSISWQHGNWATECCVENFLDRRMSTRTKANYGVYQSVSESLSDLKGRNISVSVTYTLPYGKKTDRDRIETESKINSAILRPF